MKEESFLKMGEEEEWMKKVPKLADVKVNPNLRSDTHEMGEVVELENIYETNSCQLAEDDGQVKVKVNVIPGSKPKEEKVAARRSQGRSDIKVKVNVIPGSNLDEEVGSLEEEQKARKQKQRYLNHFEKRCS